MSGVYICEIWWVDGIMWIWVLCGLNLFGLKFYYWLDKYINNFIWGVVVVVCLLVLMLFVCFVKKYCYRVEEELVNSNGF